MAVVRTAESLRREQVEISRLAWAFAISLCLHLLMFGGFQAGKRYGWWQRTHWPAWLQSRRSLQHLNQEAAKRQSVAEEIPLVFVEVSPAQATPEPPKKASFYSTQNSKAGNKESDQETTVPKIEGNKPEVVKTEEVPREKFLPLQPIPPPAPAPPAKEPQEEVKAAPAYQPGALTMAKPDLNPPKKAEGEAKQEKPKTVAEALARQASQLPGHKMRQEGGVNRHTAFDSLDAKASPFGNYDWALVKAIQKAWFDLLEEQGYAADYRGKVMLRFRLHYDGSITDLTIVDNTAGWIAGSICETAIEKPKPYGKFPSDMRRVVGDIRSIQFTFFYD